MWISRAAFDTVNNERRDALHERATLYAELNQALAENRTLREQHARDVVFADWARVRINHVERQFASVLYSKTGIELPMPKIEAAPTEQANPNMLPDFGHVEDDDPAFKAHPDWFTTGPEPFPLEESQK